MKKIRSYSVEHDGVPNLYKSSAIVGNFEPNISAPLVYLRKPNWISDEQFKKIVSAIRLDISEKDFYNIFPREKIQ